MSETPRNPTTNPTAQSERELDLDQADEILDGYAMKDSTIDEGNLYFAAWEYKEAYERLLKQREKPLPSTTWISDDFQTAIQILRGCLTLVDDGSRWHTSQIRHVCNVFDAAQELLTHWDKEATRLKLTAEPGSEKE